jgi:hypothetical protein
MCNCVKSSPALLGQRRPRASAQPRTLYAVFDGEERISAPFRSVGAATQKRERLCQGQENCTLTVEVYTP